MARCEVAARPFVLADAAVPITVRLDVCRLPCPRMPVLAGRRIESPPIVLRFRHRLQMVRIHADRVSAQVISLPTLRDRGSLEVLHSEVRHAHDASFNHHLAGVVLRRSASQPRPAAVGLFPHVQHEAFLRRDLPRDRHASQYNMGRH